MTTSLQIVDDAATGRVLVTGQLPPAGRDLDIFAPEPTFENLRAELRRLGFTPRQTTWATFEPQELIDLRLLSHEEMLERAVPVDGCVNVCRPDDADGLRLLAAAHAEDRLLTPSRRRRAAVSPEVWAQAHARGHGRELTALADALRSDDDTAVLTRRVTGRVRRMREAGVIALSGVDGSGKSTQAERLCQALNTAGIDTVIEWNRISHDRWLDTIATPIKRLLRAGSPTAAPSPDSEPATEPESVGGSASSVPSGARGLWVIVVALANALAHVRAVRRHTLAGRVVICDRYVLDSVVQLTSDYPAGLGRRLGVRLVRLVSPRPIVAFHLALPAEVAAARKPWPGPPEQLARHAAGYAEHAERLGVRQLDATRPTEALAAEIARTVWQRL